jgi:adenylosuccinate synthase
MNVDVIVDLQFGSTAKGKLAQSIAFNYESSVRVQSIQAGHTVYYNGIAYKMQTIPCAWVNPRCRLILGAGCFIRPDILLREIAWITDATGVDPRSRMLVDYRATLITDDDKIEEEERALTERMGSTSEGAGASLIRKLWRAGGVVQAKDTDWFIRNQIPVGDSILEMNNSDDDVLLEGCQGTMLGVHTTPYYPNCTSRECSVSGIMSEAGFAPKDVRTIYGVFRTFPIRVGGNSGVTGADEVSWEEIAEYRGAPVTPERTTVTNRERRIFNFSVEDMAHALMINKPDQLVLTFLDYINAEDANKTRWEDLSIKSQRWVEECEQLLEQEIRWISTGPSPEAWIRRA